MSLTAPLLFALLSQIDPTTAPAATPGDIDVEALLNLVVGGIQQGNWWIVAGPLLALVIHLGRSFIAPRYPKLSEFLAKPLVAFSLPFVLSFLVSTVQTMATVHGLPNQAQLIALLAAAVKVAATAIATYVGVKKHVEAKELAAEKAAAVVTDKQAALAELNKPPAP